MTRCIAFHAAAHALKPLFWVLYGVAVVVGAAVVMTDAAIEWCERQGDATVWHPE